MIDDNLLDFNLPKNTSSNIKVIGLGGGGGNAVNYMYESGIKGVDFVICNTDLQALDISPVPNKIQIGVELTSGLGAGANPEVGERAAEESKDIINKLLDSNTKMLFITAGMGGGTGTGAAPVVARLAKEKGILTVGVVTVPFVSEGGNRMEYAKTGLKKLRDNVDTLLVINNQKLIEIYGDLRITEAFSKANEVLTIATKGIAEVISQPLMVNIDLMDAKRVLENSGTALMGQFEASGDHRAIKAVEGALDSPLLNESDIHGAHQVLLKIICGTGENEITITELSNIKTYIQKACGSGSNVNIIEGIGTDESMGDKVNVTVIATGFKANEPMIDNDEEKVHELPIEKDQNTNLHDKELLTKPELENVKNSGTLFDSSSLLEKTQENITESNDFNENENIDNKDSFVLDSNENKVVYELDLDNEKISDNLVENHNFSDVELDSAPVTDDLIVNNDLELDSAPVTDDLPLNNDLEKNETNIKLKESINMDSISDFQFDNQIEKLDEQKDNLESSSDSVARNLNPEKQMLKSRERLDKLKKLTEKLRTPSGVSDLENEPAYKRASLDLNDESLKVEDETKIILDNKDGEIQIKEDNSFLHDNID
ncbi:MAG: cell division protein FtsZ [Flavobacteriales bacterium]|nr:cell division protein FtsZ [Flavobacteriales bacterium]